PHPRPPGPVALLFEDVRPSRLLLRTSGQDAGSGRRGRTSVPHPASPADLCDGHVLLDTPGLPLGGCLGLEYGRELLLGAVHTQQLHRPGHEVRLQGGEGHVGAVPAASAPLSAPPTDSPAPTSAPPAAS